MTGQAASWTILSIKSRAWVVSSLTITSATSGCSFAVRRPTSASDDSLAITSWPIRTRVWVTTLRCSSIPSATRIRREEASSMATVCHGEQAWVTPHSEGFPLASRGNLIGAGPGPSARRAGTPTLGSPSIGVGSVDVQRGATMGSQPAHQLSIQDDRQNGVARLALRGELDLTTAPELDGHLERVEQDGVQAVLLDLRDLTFVDSTGLHAFLNARSRAADNGHRFALVGANERIRKLLQLTAIRGMLEEHGVSLLARFTQASSAPLGISVDGDGHRDG